MKKLKFTLAIAGASLFPNIANAVTRCTIFEKMICGQGKTCESIKNEIVIQLEFEKQIYSRCDAKGCDNYKAQFYPSGEYINISVGERGVLAKLSRDGSSFVEAATIGNQILLSFGSCK